MLAQQQQGLLRMRPGSSRAASLRASAVAVGDKLPEAKFRYFDSEGNMKELGTEQLCKGKKVVLFAVPGAFTPTCSMKHLPGFIEKAEEIKVRPRRVDRGWWGAAAACSSGGVTRAPAPALLGRRPAAWTRSRACL